MSDGGTEREVPVLEARGLCKTFRKGPLEVEVLRGVSVGERLVVVGAFALKSELLR